MEVGHLRQRDLIPILGRQQRGFGRARKLAEFFHAPISLFI
jgi:hypothetical protein